MSGRRGLVAIDVDDTLVPRRGTVSGAVRAEVARAIGAGWTIVLATGRSAPRARAVLDECPELGDCWVVCTDGAVVYPPGSREPSVADLVGWVDPLPRLREMFEDLTVVLEQLDGNYLATAPLRDDDFPGPHRLVRWDDMVARQVPRMFLRTGTGTVDVLRDHLVAAGTYSNVVYELGGYVWADLHAPGVTKATALERLRRAAGIDAADTVAVGDSWNDIDMLRWARIGAATANAPPELLAVADLVVPSCAEDGVAVLLRQHLPPVDGR